MYKFTIKDRLYMAITGLLFPDRFVRALGSKPVVYENCESCFPILYGEEAHAIQKRPTTPAFPGYVIGWYQRLDGPRGYVLQHERDKIVHVYPEQAVGPGLCLRSLSAIRLAL